MPFYDISGVNEKRGGGKSGNDGIVSRYMYVCGVEFMFFLFVCYNLFINLMLQCAILYLLWCHVLAVLLGGGGGGGCLES